MVATEGQDVGSAGGHLSSIPRSRRWGGREAWPREEARWPGKEDWPPKSNREEVLCATPRADGGVRVPRTIAFSSQNNPTEQDSLHGFLRTG